MTTMKVVSGRCVRTALNKSSNCLAVAGSKLPVGSSARMRSGSFTNARTAATLCCSPPLSSAG
ncbi:MAG: hypothetical protein RMK83_09535 [Flavobacteriales bacterium]|nr:hypothetical protein [Flavobacteriales bacterium]